MIADFFNILLFIISFLFVLSSLVFFHELGHYSVARFFKVAVDRFSIGFGKPIWTRKARSGTEWTISAIPLGGYVKFMGDAGAASNPDAAHLETLKAEIGEAADAGRTVKDCFHFKPLYQRVLIVLAGPMANFILAMIIFAALALGYGTRELQSIVLEVSPGGAAMEAGVQVGDRFLTLNGKDVSKSTDLITYVSLRSGVDLQARVARGEDVIEFNITPKRKDRRDFIGGKNAIGTIGVIVGGEDAEIRRRYNLVEATVYGAEQVAETIGATGTYIGRIFQGREDGKALGGVLRIATMTGSSAVQAAALDISTIDRIKAISLSLLSIGATLSIGLGVANLMPIPALDGGHLLFYGYEAVAGRPLDETKQEMGFRIGFAFLLTLLVILTWNDIGYIRSFFS